MALNIYTKETNGTETLFLTVYPTDDSYHLSELQGKDVCEIRLEMAQYVNFPLGAYIYWRGEKYTLDTPAIVEKNGAAKLEYTLTFQGTVATLSKYITRHIVDGVLQDAKVKFSITAYPHEILQLIVDNLNYRDSGWTAGTCEPTDTVVLSFTQTTIKDALSQLATETECEYEVEGKTISIKKKVEYYKSSPLALQYGKGNGLRPGVGRKNSSDSNPMEVLFVQGGERNINSATYGSQTVLLPAGMPTIGFDGEHFSDEDGYNEENARTYKASEDRMSIGRADKELTHATEAAATFDDVYPHREGTITSIVEEKENIIDFADTAIPDTLDYKALTAEGQSLTVVFNSGMLCGKEFEVNYIASTKTFQLINTTIDGVNMPNNVWRPAVGDRYVVLNMYMPDEFLCDTDNKAGAEWELFREAVKYMFDNEDNKFDFSGKLDSIYAHNNWENIGGKIKVGSYVKFTDPQFEADGVLLRIQSVKEGINDPYAPELTLSNKQSSASIASKIVNIEKETPYKIELAKKEAQNYAARSYAQVRETTAMLQEQFAALGNFDESISPLSVQTMQLIAGDESLQFEFIDSTTDPTVITPVISCTGGRLTIAYSDSTDVPFYLRHRTLGQTTMSTATAERTYLTWEVYNWESGDLDPDKPYYVYAHCPHDTTTQATFKVSDTAIAMDADADAYTLLLGFLNTAADADADRTFAQMYGYTEILPSRITTDKIVSADGKTYFDLVNGEIGGNIKFTATADNTTVINSIINNNTTVKNAQSQAEWAEQLADGASLSAESAMADASNALSTANSAKAAVANAGLAGRNYALKTSVPVTYTSTDDTKQLTLYYYQGVLGNAASLQGATVTVSFDYEVELVQGSFNLMVDQVWYGLKEFNNSNGDGTVANTINESGHFSKTFTLQQTLSRIQSIASNSGLPLGYVYIQGNFEGSCRLSNFKWELGSTETAWQPAPEDSQYLFETLTEARGDKTDIQGGLVLSSFLGVRNSSGNIVAGLSGADGAVQNLTPMIWAGATSNTDDGLGAASFRVYNSGKTVMKNAKIVGTDGSKGMTIEGGVIRLGTVSNEEISDTACNMKITPNKDYTTVSNQISALGAISNRLWASTTTSTAKSFSPSISYSLSTLGTISQTATTYTTISSFTIASTAASGTLTFTNESIAGSSYYGPMQLVSCSNVMATLDSSLRAFSLSVDMSITFRCVVYKNGAETLELFSVKKSASGAAGQDLNGNDGEVTSCSALLSLSDMQSVLRWQGTKTIPFAASDVIEIRLYCTIWMRGSGTYTLKPTSEIKPRLTISFKPTLGFQMVGVCTPQQPIYSNNYCGNGYTLSSTASKYMAVNSTASDGEIMRLRSSSAMVKFNSSGLLQSLNGGSSFHRVNPFVGVLKIVFNSAKSYTGNWRTWWYTKTNVPSVSITCEKAGQLRIKHSIGRDDTLWYVTHYNIGTYKYGRSFSFKDDPQDSNNYTWLYINSGNSNYDLQNAGDQIYILCMVLNTWLN